MSYALETPCGSCEKEKECTDHVHIREAIEKIHENCCDEGGHLGAGAVVLMCARCKSID